MSTHEITSKVRELKELKAQMLTKGVDEMQVDIFKIKYKTVISRRFDSKSFKATHQELYNQYCKATEYRRFTVA